MSFLSNFFFQECVSEKNCNLRFLKNYCYEKHEILFGHEKPLFFRENRGSWATKVMGTTPPCLCFPIRKLFIACCDDLKIISELLCGKSKGTGFRSTWVLCRKVTHNSYHPIQLSVNTAVSHCIQARAVAYCRNWKKILNQNRRSKNLLRVLTVSSQSK